MNLHEYQAKELLRPFGVPVPDGEPCQSPEKAREIADRLFQQGHQQIVVKSQIHAGGRGKGRFQDGFKGGVQLCDTPEATEENAARMLNNVLVTHQTGPEGKQVRTVLVAGAETILNEYYLAVVLDRASGRPLLMASTEGGVDIEEVAARSPEKIARESVDPAIGMMPYQARKLTQALDLEKGLLKEAGRLFLGVYQAWWETDASLLEINPLAKVRTPDGQTSLRVVDAKLSVDDNALERHPEIRQMRDLAEESPLEIQAAEHDLNYIKLDGNIACLVNGAGLAMATMDIIKHYGGDPANFLDVGGGASKEQVTAAFRIILSDPNVKAILVNIFGGIMQCDIIAAGIVAAVKETQLDLPLVVRLEGNNVALGKQILADSQMAIINAETMADAARKAVEAAQGTL